MVNVQKLPIFNPKPKFCSVEIFLHLDHKSTLYRMPIQNFMIFHHLQYICIYKIHVYIFLLYELSKFDSGHGCNEDFWGECNINELIHEKRIRFKQWQTEVYNKVIFIPYCVWNSLISCGLFLTPFQHVDSKSRTMRYEKICAEMKIYDYQFI